MSSQYARGCPVDGTVAPNNSTLPPYVLQLANLGM